MADTNPDSTAWHNRQTPMAAYVVSCLFAYCTAPGLAAPGEAPIIALPAGVHPRVLFTTEELPAIRAKGRTPGGQAAIAATKWKVDHPGLGNFRKLQSGERGNASALVHQAFNAAVVYLVTEDAAYLKKATDMIAWWLFKTKRKPDGRFGYKLPLIYDFLFADLPADVRVALLEEMASVMTAETRHTWQTKGYFMGPVKCGRPCDWGALESGAAATKWFAIEGEDPRATPEMLQAIVDFMKYIADYGISPEGQLLAGNGYAAGDFEDYGYALEAMRRHGIALVDHPHLREYPIWLAYESIPGMYLFDNRNNSGGHHQGLCSMMVTLANRHGSVAAWLMDEALGPDRTGSYGVPGLLYGSFLKERPAPPKLPLHRWSSSMGTVFSRSGWRKGSYFCVTMEPPGGGKVHADKGSFTFTSHGQSFAADPGVTFVTPQDHSTILIDGQGQYNSGGGSVADAIVRTCLFSGLADLTHVDVKPAYDRYLAYTRTRPGVVDWTRLRYGRGLPFRWATHAPVHHADRYAVYVRGSVHPYVVIVDDIQKDDKPHTHQWLMHSPAPCEVRGTGAAFVSRFGGTYYQNEKGSTRGVFQATVPASGEYSLFALMRKRPDRRNWFSHTITAYVNKKTVPYFRLGHYTKGWQWCPLGAHSLVAGTNRVGIRVARGGQVAQVIAASDPAFAPQFALAAGSGTALVFAWESGDANGDWSAQRDAQPRMDLHFLQPGADGLKLDVWRKPRRVPPCLRAQQRAVRAGFAALLVPHDADDPAPQYQAGPGGSGQATLAWGGLTDHLFADPAGQAKAPGSPIVSDGRFAMVRTEAGQVTAYLLVAGTTLSFRGQLLVRASAGSVCAMNDGNTFQAQCPPGATIQACPVGVTRTVCNRREQVLRRPASATLELEAPVLAKTWKITFSPDRTLFMAAAWWVYRGSTPRASRRRWTASGRGESSSAALARRGRICSTWAICSSYPGSDLR